MAVHSNCPKCHKQVLVPEGAGDAVVRCPLCHEEYDLSEAHALLAPALIVVRPSATAAVGTGPYGTVQVPDVAASSETLREREHVVPVTTPHDEAEDLQFSDFKVAAEPDTSFHLESPESGEHATAEVYGGETVYFDGPLITQGDVVPFDPEQPFEPVAMDPHAEAHHDDNPFGPELFTEHGHGESTHNENGHGQNGHDSHEPGEHGIEMLHEPASGEDAPWNPSSWGESSEHESAAEHEHHEGDEIAVVDGDAMSAVDFAGISSDSASTSGDPAAPGKKKKRRQSSGGGMGRLVGIVVSGLAAVPAVGLLGAIMGQNTDVFGFRPYLQKVPYISKYVGAPAKVQPATAPKVIAASKPTTTAPVGEVNATQPTGPILNGPQLPETPAKAAVESKPDQVAANPAPTQPNKPFNHADEAKPDTVAANSAGAKSVETMKPIEAPKPNEPKPNDNVPNNLVADAGTPKKPADKAAANDGDKGDDPFSTPAAPGDKPDTKPDAKTEVADPLAGPAKPDVNIPAPEVKPVGTGAMPPTAVKEVKPEDIPAAPEAKAPDVKPPEVKADAKSEMKPEVKPEATPDARPADKTGDAGDPFSAPDVKPEAKVEKKPEPKPDLPPPEAPASPEKAKPQLMIPLPAGDVPIKPDLKTETPSEIKPEVKPETKPAIEPTKIAPFNAAELTTPTGYDTLCKAAEVFANAKGSDKGKDDAKKYFDGILTKLAAHPEAAGKLTAMAKSKLDNASSTGGVVLTGSVIVSIKRGELYGTALKIEGQADAVTVFSAHSLDVNANDKVLVPGAIVREPAKNLPGYSGKKPVIVWADSAVKLP